MIPTIGSLLRVRNVRRPRRALFLAVPALALSLAACSSSPAPSSPAPSFSAHSSSPQAVYQTLLRTPFAPGVLPAGFQARTGPIQGDPNDTDHAHHVVGEVDFPLRGPDAGDQIEMIVFPTAADATADLANGLRQDPADHINTGTEPAPGFTVPARVYDVKVVQPGQTTGVKAFSHCVATVDTVLVVGSAAVAGDHDRGDPQHACALAHAGITHLNTVQRLAANPQP